MIFREIKAILMVNVYKRKFLLNCRRKNTENIFHIRSNAATGAHSPRPAARRHSAGGAESDPALGAFNLGADRGRPALALDRWGNVAPVTLICCGSPGRGAAFEGISISNTPILRPSSSRSVGPQSDLARLSNHSEC